MEVEEFIKLNNIRKELEIPKDFFISIVSLALKFQITNNINSEECFEIIKESINNYDYELNIDEYSNCDEIKAIEFAYAKRKNVKQCFLKALASLNYIDNYNIKKK